MKGAAYPPRAAFLSGPRYLLCGFRLLTRRGVRRYVAIPLAANTLLFAGMLWFLGDRFGQLTQWLLGYLPEWLGWLTWLFWGLFALTAGIMLFFGFSLLANLIGAPFNGYLAAAVEEHLTGTRPPESPNSIWREALVAVGGELLKWSYYLLWMIPLWLASLLLAPAAPLLWFLFGAWMYSIEYTGYPLGNHGLTFRGIRRSLRNRRGLALGFGGAVTLATMTPLLNFLVMPAAVAGATAMAVAHLPETGRRQA